MIDGHTANVIEYKIALFQNLDSNQIILTLYVLSWEIFYKMYMCILICNI